MPLFSNNFESFGLDIGDRSLKAAQVKKIGNTPTLVSYGSVALPDGVLLNGEIKQSDNLANIIRQLLQNIQGKKINTAYVHACLPEVHSFIKLLSINGNDEKELPAGIREELPNHIPVPVDDLYLDWEIIGRNDGTTRVLVGAVPRAIVDSYTACLISAGLAPVSLQIEAEAILRSLLPLRDVPQTSIGVIDFGATRSSFICFDHGTIQFTITLPTSSDGITEIISQKLQLSREEAEKAKRLCGLDKNSGEGIVVDLVNEAIDKLVVDIKKSADYYNEHFALSSPINSIILCGGGANLKNLQEVLSAKLAPVNVYQGNPLINLVKNIKKIAGQNTSAQELNFLAPDLAFEKIKSSSPLTGAEALSYTTAIGLALSNVT